MNETHTNRFIMHTNRNIELKYIRITFEFIRILEIDSINEKYTAEICIESEWYEDDEIVEYSTDKNWNPKLFIENSLSITEKIKYSVKKDIDKYVVTENRFIRGTFWERLELQNVI